VRFEGTTFTRALRGLAVVDSDDIVVRNAHFTNLRSDGMDVAGTSHVLLENNRFDTFSPVWATGSKADGTWKDGDHPDAIQLWTTPNVRRVTDITIRGNVIDAETQGINFFGPRGDGYARVNVTNNDVTINLPAAISVFACDDCSVRDNRITARPGSKWRANIRFEQSTGALCGNIMPGTPRHPATAAC
jgi:Right handed beta helix region